MKIIDVSHHNGKINWLSTAKTVDSVFIKATEGATVADKMFLKNAIGASEVGLKVGYYHFATLNHQDVALDAIAEAEWFVEHIKKAPQPTLPLVLDIEAGSLKIKLPKSDVVKYIQVFLRQLILHGYHDYMIYSGAFFLNENLPKNHPLGVVKLWLADYNGAFSAPNGWESVHLHQYTDKGSIVGMEGHVDLNKYLV